MKRRYKKYLFNDNTLIQGLDFDDFKAFFKYLPKDARIVRWGHEINRAAAYFVVEHESFQEIPIHQNLPEEIVDFDKLNKNTVKWNVAYFDEVDYYIGDSLNYIYGKMAKDSMIYGKSTALMKLTTGDWDNLGEIEEAYGSTLVISKSTWAPGIWATRDGEKIEIKDRNGLSKGVYVIQHVDLNNRTLCFSLDTKLNASMGDSICIYKEISPIRQAMEIHKEEHQKHYSQEFYDDMVKKDGIKKLCNHSWKPYNGLMYNYDYCELCDEKRTGELK